MVSIHVAAIGDALPPGESPRQKRRAAVIKSIPWRPIGSSGTSRSDVSTALSSILVRKSCELVRNALRPFSMNTLVPRITWTF
uniref:Uncharacterized protein n=1 Tax=Anguilla anguilla TaxID=7936 RepID=A0A0E9QI10_ANGAN